MQPILIPGLGASIDVGMVARFDPVIPVLPGSNNFLSSFNAKYMLPDQKVTTNLTVWVHLLFPSHKWKPTGQSSYMYQQTITGTFMHVKLADGKINFADPGPIVLNPDKPYGPYGDTSETSLFRYIDGRAWLHTPNDSGVGIVKIKLVLGSQDVIVISWEEVKEGRQTNVTFGEGAADEGGVLGKAKGLLRAFVPKVEFVGGKTTKTKGQQWTPGQLSQQPEWTLALVMPERPPPPPPPGPFGLAEPYTIYFDTGKSNADGYRSPLNRMQDQIKFLRESMKRLDKEYGLENVESVRVVGYASGLGDNGPNGSRPNLNLSLARAQYVAKLLSDLYDTEIPGKKVTIRPEGSPYNSNGKDNNPEDRRAELLIKMRGGARRKVP